MRLTLNRTIILLLTTGTLCLVHSLEAENIVVIRPEDFAQIDVNARTVSVLINGPKVKQLAEKERRTTIQFNVPFNRAKEVLIGETHFGTHWATISFKFPTEESASDFAALLKKAKVKILSQCDCH
jgi:hypothetical protein